ncbi:MAG: DUF1801 domain-containing protein [Myxococcales bacterium]|nr:DUF1801 domain-containing protein [Myxococcales bacterium]
MKEPKTHQTEESPQAFVDAVANRTRQADAHVLLAMFSEITGAEPRMWGPSIIGFGRYTMTYGDGRERDWLLTGFSPRKANLVLYIMDGVNQRPDLLGQLGKHRVGKSCLYINKLADVDMAVLRELIEAATARMDASHPTAR